MRIAKATFLHLRVPFSYFLTPMFSFALLFAEGPTPLIVTTVFLIVHLLLYPATNAYNSYYDRDEGSIGGLRSPPPVNRQLLYVSLILDAIAIVLGWLVSPTFALFLLIYGAGSKAYSHDRLRLKRFAVSSWLMVGIGQGGVTVLAFYFAMSGLGLGARVPGEVLVLAGLVSFFLMASYPLTQIYQHEEDGRRADVTMSMLLGIKGTFHFSAALFALVGAGFTLFFSIVRGVVAGLFFIGSQVPTMWYVIRWYMRVRRDPDLADYRSSMRTNFISATALNLFCVVLLVSGSTGVAS